MSSAEAGDEGSTSRGPPPKQPRLREKSVEDIFAPDTPPLPENENVLTPVFDATLTPPASNIVLQILEIKGESRDGYIGNYIFLTDYWMLVTIVFDNSDICN